MEGFNELVHIVIVDGVASFLEAFSILIGLNSHFHKSDHRQKKGRFQPGDAFEDTAF
jgi:hypothetical protein